MQDLLTSYHEDARLNHVPCEISHACSSYQDPNEQLDLTNMTSFLDDIAIDVQCTSGIAA
jgi:hypothetical protein